MADNREIFGVLTRHGVPFVVIGGHAVNLHGYGRATEDTDVIWIRSAESENALLAALAEIDAHYIGNEIDRSTGIERTYPVTLKFIQISHLMVLITKWGFLDLFDYVPGLPQQDVGQLFSEGVESSGVRYASLDSLRKMKLASGRAKDRIDLENLPE